MSKFEDYEDKIDEWHESDSELKLHEFLGLTWQEYKDLCNPLKNGELRTGSRENL